MNQPWIFEDLSRVTVKHEHRGDGGFLTVSDIMKLSFKKINLIEATYISYIQAPLKKHYHEKAVFPLNCIQREKLTYFPDSSHTKWKLYFFCLFV